MGSVMPTPSARSEPIQAVAQTNKGSKWRHGLSAPTQSEVRTCPPPLASVDAGRSPRPSSWIDHAPRRKAAERANPIVGLGAVPYAPKIVAPGRNSMRGVRCPAPSPLGAPSATSRLTTSARALGSGPARSVTAAVSGALGVMARSFVANVAVFGPPLAAGSPPLEAGAPRIAGLLGSTAMLMASAMVATSSPHCAADALSSRTPRMRPCSSTSSTVARSSSLVRTMRATMVFSADGKNGSYPRRAATACRTAVSSGHVSAPLPRA